MVVEGLGLELEEEGGGSVAGGGLEGVEGDGRVGD